MTAAEMVATSSKPWKVSGGMALSLLMVGFGLLGLTIGTNREDIGEPIGKILGKGKGEREKGEKRFNYLTGGLACVVCGAGPDDVSSKSPERSQAQRLETEPRLPALIK